MKILILKMERKTDGHIIFIPSLPSDTSVIYLPPEATRILITTDGNINCIYAVDESEVEYFE